MRLCHPTRNCPEKYGTGFALSWSYKIENYWNLDHILKRNRMIRVVLTLIVVSVLGYVLIDAQQSGTACTVQGGGYIPQGQTVYLNCSAKCTCVTAYDNRVVCTDPCLDFTGLPRECHMNPPPAGRCCPQPSCPPTVTINIPPQYAQEYPTVFRPMVG